MSTQSLSDAAEVVLALVRRQQTGTSCVEIAKALSIAGFVAEGDMWISHPSDSNLVMWTAASDVFVDALTELLGAGLVHYAPTDPLVYMYDGRALNLPLAKQPPKTGYREPHWLPIVINVGPTPPRGA